MREKDGERECERERDYRQLNTKKGIKTNERERKNKRHVEIMNDMHNNW